MTREKAIKVLDMFLHKQCDLERTKCSYDENTVWAAVRFARDAIEKEPDALAIDLREVSNWIVATASTASFAHDELNALHYADTVRDAADKIEKQQAEIERLKPYEANLIKICEIYRENMESALERIRFDEEG